MKCSVEGCDRKEWMAREICDRHWNMLPAALQLRIRNALKSWRAAPGSMRTQWRATLNGIYSDAFKIIAEQDEVQHVAKQIGIFRTHMATVAGIVVAIRTVPLRETREQLARSDESLLATDPDEHAKVKERIECDLALLEILVDTDEKLAAVIRRFAPAAS